MTRLIHRLFTAVIIIILAMHSDTETVHQALSAGAQGYLDKEANEQEVISAINTALSGRRYLSAFTVDQVIDAFIHHYHQKSALSLLDLLSKREYEVLQMVVSGSTSKEIAQQLYLSPNTVDTYRSRIMSKMDVTDLSSLVRKSIEIGIQPTPKYPEHALV